MPTSLRGGLSFCTLGDRIVFLDLPADRYFGLSHDAEDVFRRALAGLPISGAERDLLVKARIIALGDAPLCLAPCAAETAHRSAFDQTPCPSRRRDVAALAWHLLRARVSLRLRGLPATAASLGLGYVRILLKTWWFRAWDDRGPAAPRGLPADRR